MFEYKGFIEAHEGVCGGYPVVKGTRVRLKVVLDSLAEGHSVDEITNAFPGITREAVQAVIAYAAASVADDAILPLPLALSA